MRLRSPDLGHLEHTIAVLESIAEHRRAHPTTTSDMLFYEMLVGYYRQLLEAKKDGKFVVALGDIITPEIVYALDCVPFGLTTVATAQMTIQRDFEETFTAAREGGLRSEVCSNHRAVAGAFVRGLMPRPDAIVWSNLVCDNSAKSPEYLIDGCDVPSYFIERPYRYDRPGIEYLAAELEGLADFLAEHSGNRKDPGRVQEALELVKRQTELHQEIYDLRRAVPTPTANRRTLQVFFASWYFGGRPESVAYHEAARDEIKQKMEAGEGHVPQERFRLLSLFVPPHYNWKLLDWMEQEHGAAIVADPYTSHWGEMEWDFSRPWETLARKCFASPVSRQMMGPIDEGLVADSLADAETHQAEGAIYWAHIGCRQSCAVIRLVKDALMEKAGIPTLVIDCDVADPTYASEDKLKDQLEGFFEILEERR